jgi:hypothetical protein
MAHFATPIPPPFLQPQQQQTLQRNAEKILFPTRRRPPRQHRGKAFLFQKRQKLSICTFSFSPGFCPTRPDLGCGSTFPKIDFSSPFCLAALLAPFKKYLHHLPIFPSVCAPAARLPRRCIAVRQKVDGCCCCFIYQKITLPLPLPLANFRPVPLGSCCAMQTPCLHRPPPRPAASGCLQLIRDPDSECALQQQAKETAAGAPSAFLVAMHAVSLHALLLLRGKCLASTGNVTTWYRKAGNITITRHNAVSDAGWLQLQRCATVGRLSRKSNVRK